MIDKGVFYKDAKLDQNPLLNELLPEPMPATSALVQALFKDYSL
jgi:hypothetical protein